jgi:hypothetical protein
MLLQNAGSKKKVGRNTFRMAPTNSFSSRWNLQIPVFNVVIVAN